MLRGERPCEPCRYLDRVTGQAAKAALQGRGGLRATIVTGGRPRAAPPWGRSPLSRRTWLAAAADQAGPALRQSRRTSLQVAGSSPAARATLMALPDAFVDDCLDATGGNPLFLLALLDEVSRREVDLGSGAVHDVGSALVARSIRRRLVTLPPAATRYAEALAVLGNRRWPAVVQRMAAVDAVTAQRSWSAMVDSGLLTTSTDTGFVHPIVWSSVRDGLAPSRRADLHAQSAALLQSAGATAEEIAAHILRCPPGSIDLAVEPLRKAASNSWARGAPDVATTYLGRALEEPLTAIERQQVLLALGSAEAAAGDARAREHLTAAVELAPSAAARVAAAGALAKVLYGLGETRSAVTMLLAELDATSDEPDRRQVEDVLFEMVDLDLSLRPLLSAGTPRDRPQTTLQHAHRAVMLTLAGVDRTGARLSAEAALGGDALLDGHELSFLIVSFLMSQQDAYDDAVAAYSRAIEAAHRRGSAVGTAVAMAHRGRTRAYQGRLAMASPTPGRHGRSRQPADGRACIRSSPRGTSRCFWPSATSPRRSACYSAHRSTFRSEQPRMRPA